MLRRISLTASQVISDTKTVDEPKGSLREYVRLQEEYKEQRKEDMSRKQKRQKVRHHHGPQHEKVAGRITKLYSRTTDHRTTDRIQYEKKKWSPSSFTCSVCGAKPSQPCNTAAPHDQNLDEKKRYHLERKPK